MAGRCASSSCRDLIAGRSRAIHDIVIFLAARIALFWSVRIFRGGEDGTGIIASVHNVLDLVHVCGYVDAMRIVPGEFVSYSC